MIIKNEVLIIRRHFSRTGSQTELSK